MIFSVFFRPTVDVVLCGRLLAALLALYAAVAFWSLPLLVGRLVLVPRHLLFTNDNFALIPTQDIGPLLVGVFLSF